MNRNHLVAVVSVVAVVSAVMESAVIPATAAPSGDYDRQWPRWRGPRATGVAPSGSPPVEWGEKKNLRWKTPIPGRGLSTPIVWNGRIFLITAIRIDKQVDPARVRRAAAKLPEWRRKDGTAPTHVVAFAVLAIDLAGARGDITGSEAIVRQADRDTPYVPPPLLHDGRLDLLKGSSGIVSADDATSGKAHYGPARLDGIDGVYASPVGAGGRVFLAGRNGVTLVLEGGNSVRLLATNRLDNSFSASPADACDELLLRGLENLYCIAD